MRTGMKQWQYAVLMATVLVVGPASCKEDMKRLAVFHEAHEEQELTCDICHEEVDVVEMTASAVTADTCEVCHAESAPPTHDGLWTKVHGEESRFGAGMCNFCHESNECDMCHQITEPDDHNTFWRRRGHGLEAEWDRSRCMVCHQDDFCVRCHS